MYRITSCNITLYYVSHNLVIIVSTTGVSPVPSWCVHTNSATPPCTRTLDNLSVYKRTNCQWFSQPFYTSDKGYKLQLNVAVNGDGSGKRNYLSLFVFLMKGEYDDELSWPLEARVAVQLLNWSSDDYHEKKTIDHETARLKYRKRVRVGDRALGGVGREQFIQHSELLNSSKDHIKFVNNDSICFRIVRCDVKVKKCNE